MQQAITQTKRNAIAVRMGEQRILCKTLEKLQDISVKNRVNKRKRLDDDGAERDKRGGRK
jgi:hypothetical protein